MQQSSVTPKKQDVGRGLWKIVTCSQSYLPGPSCSYNYSTIDHNVRAKEFISLNMSAVALLFSPFQPSDCTLRELLVFRISSASSCSSERRQLMLASNLAHCSP